MNSHFVYNRLSRCFFLSASSFNLLSFIKIARSIYETMNWIKLLLVNVKNGLISTKKYWKRTLLYSKWKIITMRAAQSKSIMLELFVHVRQQIFNYFHKLNWILQIHWQSACGGNIFMILNHTTDKQIFNISSLNDAIFGSIDGLW